MIDVDSVMDSGGYDMSSLVCNIYFKYVFVLSSLFFFLLAVLPAESSAREVEGQFRHRGKEVVYNLNIAKNHPGAMILVQYLPPGTGIEKAIPPYRSYDKRTGVAKWLFSGVKPGKLNVRLYLDHPLAQGAVRAEVLFKEGAGSLYDSAPAQQKSMNRSQRMRRMKVDEF